MNRQIAVERIFALGDYQNIKVTDTVTEVPEYLSSNPNAMKLLRYLQLVDVEWTYLNYQKIRAQEPKLNSMDAIEQAVEFMEEERTRTFEELLKSIQDRKEQEEKKYAEDYAKKLEEEKKIIDKIAESKIRIVPLKKGE